MPRTRGNAPSPPPGYVWTPEAAELMSVTVPTLWNYHHQGKGPQPTRYRGRLAYKLADIEAHVAAELASSDPDLRESRPAEPRRTTSAAA